jgi:hypothetical protein
MLTGFITGNYAGQYSQNVLAPLGNPTVTADAPGY